MTTTSWRRSQHFVCGRRPHREQIRTTNHGALKVKELYRTPAQLGGHLTPLSIRLCIRIILVGRLLAIEHKCETCLPRQRTNGMLLKSQPSAKVQTRKESAAGIIGAVKYMGLGQQTRAIDKLHAERVILVFPVGRRPVQAIDAYNYRLRDTRDGYGCCEQEKHWRL